MPCSRRLNGLRLYLQETGFQRFAFDQNPQLGRFQAKTPTDVANDRALTRRLTNESWHVRADLGLPQCLVIVAQFTKMSAGHQTSTFIAMGLTGKPGAPNPLSDIAGAVASMTESDPGVES
jgi:hypothetical protein